MSFSAREKRQAAGREVGLRCKVYHGRVSRGLMTQSQADYEIAIMQSIEADYRRLEEEEAPPLFRAPVPT
jgi:hypothetical protein